MLSRIFLSWGRKFPWDQPAHELPVLLRATSTAVNPVCTIIHPSEGGSEDSVWKWIWKAQMEPHGTNPHFLHFCQSNNALTLEGAHRWVGGAGLHVDCLPTASKTQNHSTIKAGKDSQFISQCPWRNKARWWGLAQRKHLSDFNFCVRAKGKKNKIKNKSHHQLETLEVLNVTQRIGSACGAAPLIEPICTCVTNELPSPLKGHLPVVRI